MAKLTVAQLRAETVELHDKIYGEIGVLHNRILALEIEIASLKANGAQKPQAQKAQSKPKGTVPFQLKPTQALVVKSEEGRTLLSFEKDFYLANRQWCYATLRGALEEANKLGHRTDWERGVLVVHHRS